MGSTTTALIRVLHNNQHREALCDGYQPGHTLTEVLRTHSETHASNTAHAEAMFHLCNVGEDPEFGTPDPRAVQYRQRRNRGLSIGDVPSPTPPRGWPPPRTRPMPDTTRIPTRGLPGITTGGTVRQGHELTRLEVFDRNEYVGEVVYVRRKHQRGGSTYGWRPAKADPRSALTTQAEAIVAVLHHLARLRGWTETRTAPHTPPAPSRKGTIDVERS